MHQVVSLCTEISEFYGSFARERKGKNSEKKGRTIRKTDHKSGTNIQGIGFHFFLFVIKRVFGPVI